MTHITYLPISRNHNIHQVHSVTTRFFVNFIFMCLYMFVCDYLSLGVFTWVFRVRRVFWSFGEQG